MFLGTFSEFVSVKATMYQVIEETPLNDYHRELVLNGVKAHTQWLIERELNSSKASVPDERLVFTNHLSY